MKRRLKTVLTLIITVSMSLLPAVNAFAATENDVAAELLSEIDRYDLTGILNDADEAVTFPEKLDLRDRGVVTPVKLQNPFGTCWGFSAIAAAETSILSASGQTYDETGLDLSEHQLAYFTRTPLRDGSSQDGEGSYILDKTDPMNTGGWFFTATSVFSSGIGVVPERIVPYRGKEGKIDYQLGMLIEYSDKDDWTVDEDYRFLQYYQLQESNILPEPAMKKYNDLETEYEYLGYNEAGTNAIKNELMQGRAVSIAFCADQYMPGTKSSKAKYLSDSWCHYTWDNGSPNHAVTIVGWDDTVPASDFIPGHQPEGDGAWIVKNSWGAETNSFPNWMLWGIKNEEGKSTGYFYLSYYDHSISCPETFDFTKGEKEEAYMIDQYDYMPADMTPNDILSTKKMRTANVFEAEYDEYVSEISVESAQLYADVNYEIYLLSDGFKDPTDGEKVAEGNENFVYSGYHKITLSKPVEVARGGKYSIVITETIDTGDTYGVLYSLTADKAKNEAGLKDYNAKVSKEQRESAYTHAVINKGESFLYTETAGTWVDWSDVVNELHKDEVQALYDFDNFPIKGYANFKDSSLAAEFSGKNMGCCYPEPVNGEEWYQQKAYGQLLAIIIGALAAVVVLLIVIFIGLIHISKKRRWKKRLIRIFVTGDEEFCQILPQIKALSEKENRNVSLSAQSEGTAISVPGNDDYIIMKDGAYGENGKLSEMPEDEGMEAFVKGVWAEISKDAFGKKTWKHYRKNRKHYRYVERLVRK